MQSRCLHILPLALSLIPTPTFAVPVAPSPVKSIGAGKLSHASVQYTSRVLLIRSDLQFELSKLLLALDEMDEVNAPRSRRTRKTDEDDADLTARYDRSKAALLAVMPRVRANTRRLRSLTPVPRSLKKADDKFVAAAHDFELALDSLRLWLLHPAQEWRAQATREIRRGLTALELGMKTLGQRNDLPSKVYVDG